MTLRENLVDRLIVRSVYALRHGNRTEAADLLRRALAVEPVHERSWWLLSEMVDDPIEQALCFNNILALNPDNRRAAIALLALRPDLETIEQPAEMEIPEADPRRFITGGTVNRRKGIYVSREADRVLYERCLAGEFSYVLTARQRGKSSLMMRTSERLRESNIHTARVDLNRIGADLKSIDSLYVSILSEIVRDLKLPLNAAEWWREDNQSLLTSAKRFEAFIHDLLLPTLGEPLVIFIDEIDSIRKVKSNFNVDDFFALIRSIHNANAEDEIYQRLTFVLLGVARPDDLITDQTRTPFNIGENIEIADFTLTEASIMTRYLGLPLPHAEQVLIWILDWTGGHPNLTQKLCQRIAEHAPRNRTEVTALVRKVFIVPPEPDSNVKYVGSMLTPEGFGSEVLTMYYRIFTGRPVYEDDEDIATVEQLKLSGIVDVVPYHVGNRRERGMLVIRNRIYETFFDLEWIKDTLLQRYNVDLAYFEIGLRRDSEPAVQENKQNQFEEALPEPIQIQSLESLLHQSAVAGLDIDKNPVQTRDKQQNAPSSDNSKLEERLRRTGTPFDLSEFHPMFRPPDHPLRQEAEHIRRDNHVRAEALINEASNRSLNGYQQQARELIEQALALDEENTLGWLWLARVSDNREEKIRALRKVLSIEPPDNEYIGSPSMSAARLLKDLTGEDYMSARNENPPLILTPLSLSHNPLPSLSRSQVSSILGDNSNDDDAIDDFLEETPFQVASKFSTVDRETLFDDANFADDEFSFADYEDVEFGFAEADDFDAEQSVTSAKLTPRYEVRARRWFYQAQSLTKSERLYSAVDRIHLYFWFARNDALPPALRLLERLPSITARNENRFTARRSFERTLYNSSLYSILRKPWQVGKAYRLLATGKRMLDAGQPGQAQRLLYDALEQYPALLDDKSVVELIEGLTASKLDDFTSILHVLRSAPLHNDAPLPSLFQPRDWAKRFPRKSFTFPGSSTRLILLLALCILVSINAISILINSFIPIFLLIVAIIVLGTVVLKVESAAGSLFHPMTTRVMEVIQPPIDVFRYRDHSFRMLAAYRLYPRRWLSLNQSEAIFTLIWGTLFFGAYIVLFVGLSALGLSSGAIVAGTVAVVPVLIVISVLRTE